MKSVVHAVDLFRFLLLPAETHAIDPKNFKVQTDELTHKKGLSKSTILN
jgi:hypothetical protein